MGLFLSVTRCWATFHWYTYVFIAMVSFNHCYCYSAEVQNDYYSAGLLWVPPLCWLGDEGNRFSPLACRIHCTVSIHVSCQTSLARSTSATTTTPTILQPHLHRPSSTMSSTTTKQIFCFTFISEYQHSCTRIQTHIARAFNAYPFRTPFCSQT